MEDGDDDFGDLYADVELEATSAINIAPQFSKTHRVSDEIGKQDGDNDLACVSVGNDEDEDDDDDDDDLDIVLNGDDDNIKRGEGLTIAHLRNRELEDEDDDNLGAEELAGNSRSLYKYLRSQSAAYGGDVKVFGCMYWQQMGSRSMGPQTAQRFSLPRARNILDVNIDVFEQKPWKHPGADITDYFNFGFNEDSWKVYCNQVDEYRHRGPVSSGTTPSEPARSTEVETREGQSIQVEDSIFERQSSMDVRRQLDRDSDAIQITILDQEDTSVPEASNHGDGSGDDVTDHLSFSSASEDESVEVNYVETETYPLKMRSGGENNEMHQVLTNETIRTSNDTRESTLVTDSSGAEKSPANHSKSIEDDACIDRRKAYTHDRCLTELTWSGKPDYHHSQDSNKSNGKRGPDENRYHSRRLGDNKKHGDHIYHERSNSPVYKNRGHKDFNLKTHHENDYIISRRTYDKMKSGEYRYHARHNNGFFPMSDDMHSTFRQRLHSFDPYNENIPYLKSEVPSDYCGKRFCGYEDWDTKSFGANMDRSIFRSSEEDEYYDERTRYIRDSRPISGDWCHNEMDQKKGENLYSKHKGEIDEFYLDREYYDGTQREKFGSFTNDDKKRYGVEYTRWEFRGPGRNKRRVCGLYSELDAPLLKRENEQCFASRSSEEYHINNCRLEDHMMPKSSFYRRHERYRGQYFEPFVREDYMIDIDGPVDMRRNSCHWQSEIEREDEIMFRHEDAKFSLPLKNVARHKRVSEPDPDHVEELSDDPYVGSGYVKETAGQHADGCRYNKQKNEVFNGNKSNKAYGKSRERLPLSSRNSHLVVGEVKSSGKHKKPKWMNLDRRLNDKVAQADDRKATDEALDVEEGQILTEEAKAGNGSHIQNGKSGFDSIRILEAMAKMEKRRARFNAPIAISRKDSDGSIKATVVDLVQETGSNKQQRPARKRRWGATDK